MFRQAVLAASAALLLCGTAGAEPTREWWPRKDNEKQYLSTLLDLLPPHVGMRWRRMPIERQNELRKELVGAGYGVCELIQHESLQEVSERVSRGLKSPIPHATVRLAIQHFCPRYINLTKPRNLPPATLTLPDTAGVQ